MQIGKYIWNKGRHFKFRFILVILCVLGLFLYNGCVIVSGVGSFLCDACKRKDISLNNFTEVKISFYNQVQDWIKSEKLHNCSLLPPALVGPVALTKNVTTWEEIANENPGLRPGGRYKPSDCLSRHRVAIVIPYRNREEHLKILLRHLHPMLVRQQLDYGIFLIDQALPGTFNRGMLMNIGYVEAIKRYDYQCVVFHDVDLVPENDRNIYSCSDTNPRHMSASIDKFSYKSIDAIFGGVTALTKKQFQTINGFSNMYFGWGGEDDDIRIRILSHGYNITRYHMNIARYKMIKHTLDSGNEPNPKSFYFSAQQSDREISRLYERHSLQEVFIRANNYYV